MQPKEIDLQAISGKISILLITEGGARRETAIGTYDGNRLFFNLPIPPGEYTCTLDKDANGFIVRVQQMVKGAKDGGE